MSKLTISKKNKVLSSLCLIICGKDYSSHFKHAAHLIRYLRSSLSVRIIFIIIFIILVQFVTFYAVICRECEYTVLCFDDDASGTVPDQLNYSLFLWIEKNEWKHLVCKVLDTLSINWMYLQYCSLNTQLQNTKAGFILF